MGILAGDVFVLYFKRQKGSKGQQWLIYLMQGITT